MLNVSYTLTAEKAILKIYDNKYDVIEKVLNNLGSVVVERPPRVHTSLFKW